MTLSIVTVTHRSNEDAPRFVETFLAAATGQCSGRSIEFIIVENSGDAGIIEAFRPLEAAGYPVTFLQMNNHGFGAGCNMGAANARNEVLVFANPDIEFIDPIDPVMQLSGTWGTITQLNGRGQPQSFDLLPEAKNPIGELLGSYRRATPPPRKWIDKVAPIGAFLCVDRRLFQQSGGFDERIFLYYEEIELARRLHRLAGPPRYIDNVRIRHHAFGSQSSSESTWSHETNGLFAYVRITGEWTVVRRRAVLLLLLAPLRRMAWLRLRLFAKALLTWRTS